MPTQSLLDFILCLLRDSGAREEFAQHPQASLEEAGFGDLCGSDVAEALPLVIDNSRVSFDRHYDTGSSIVSISSPPPPPMAMHGESDLHAVIRQIEYVTSNYVYNDSHDTVLDNSVNQNIWADGDVFQSFDNDPVIASGAGAVAAGDDVSGTITTGDHNVVGDGNMISTGDGATSFGEGDAFAVGDVIAAGDGSAVALGGDASGSAVDDSTNAEITNFGTGNVAFAGTGGETEQIDSHDDSSVHDNPVDNSVHDNPVDASIHDNELTFDSSVHDNPVDESIHDNALTVDSSVHDNPITVTDTEHLLSDNVVGDIGTVEVTVPVDLPV